MCDGKHIRTTWRLLASLLRSRLSVWLSSITNSRTRIFLWNDTEISWKRRNQLREVFRSHPATVMILRCATWWCIVQQLFIVFLARGSRNIIGRKLPEALMKISSVSDTSRSAEDKSPTCLFPLSPSTLDLLNGYGRNRSFINIINVVWIEVVCHTSKIKNKRNVSQLFVEIPLWEKEMLVQEMQTCLWVLLEKHVEPILTYHLYGLIEIMGYFVPFG
jgi:hypothetical protein